MSLGLTAARRGGVWRRPTLALIAALALAASGCATGPGQTNGSVKAPANPSAPAAAPAAAAFGSDGRLWRAMADGEHLYVDSSSDAGKSFSSAVEVNRRAQRIRVSSDDRPHIAVDKSGRVWVTYSADGPLPASPYFAYSDDGGKSFTEPALLSDQAASARASLATLVVDSVGRPHFFWHDERDSNGGPKPERGGSLYYATMDPPMARTPAAKRVLRTACERCPIEAVMDKDGTPVLFSRFVFPVKERDHGLVKITSDGKGWAARRVTNDNWELDTCPEQGPGFSIGADGRYHVAWFTQGKNRQGLFYARSDDQGKHFSRVMPFGDKKSLASHPAVYSLGSKVALAWQEFDGRRTQIKAMLSRDGGEHWSAAKLMAQAKGAADYPLLVGDGQQIYLSWNSSELGYRLIVVE